MPFIRLIFKILFAALFVFAGFLHFVRVGFFVTAMPDYLPWHRELVYISGVIEVELGVLLLIPRYSRDAAWALVALLIAVFPANIEMALHPEKFPQFPPIGLYVRLPIQGLLIAWAYWFTRTPRKQ